MTENTVAELTQAAAHSASQTITAVIAEEEATKKNADQLQYISESAALIIAATQKAASKPTAEEVQAKLKAAEEAKVTKEVVVDQKKLNHDSSASTVAKKTIYDAVENGCSVSEAAQMLSDLIEKSIYNDLARALKCSSSPIPRKNLEMLLEYDAEFKKKFREKIVFEKTRRYDLTSKKLNIKYHKNFDDLGLASIKNGVMKVFGEVECSEKVLVFDTVAEEETVVMGKDGIVGL